MKYLTCFWLLLITLLLGIELQAQNLPFYRIRDTRSSFLLDTVLLCAGESVIFEVKTQMPSSFVWYLDGTLISSTSPSITRTQIGRKCYFTPSPNLITSGRHTIVCTMNDSLSGSKEDTIWLKIVQPPSLFPASGTSIYQGNQVLLTLANVNSFDTIRWQGFPTVGQDSLLVTPDSTTTYTCQVFIGAPSGQRRRICSRTLSTTVNVLPHSFSIRDTTICKGRDVMLEVHSSADSLNYEWSTNARFRPVINRTQQYTIYRVQTDTVLYVRALDGNRVLFTDSVTVSVRPSPLLATVSQSNVCIGDTITLSTPTATGQASSYTWKKGNAIIGLLPTIELPIATTAQEGIYSVSNEDSLGCIASGSVFVKVNNSPPPPLIIANTVYCEGETVKLKSYPSANTNSIFYWVAPNGAILNSTTVALNANSIHYMAGRWRLVAQNTLGCTSSVDTMVVIHAPPSSVRIDVDSNICLGQNTTLIAQADSTTPSMNFDWIWYRDSLLTDVVGRNSILTIDSIQISDSIFYAVATNAFGCSSIRTAVLNLLSPPPPPSIIANSVYCEGDTILVYTAADALMHRWTHDTIPYNDNDTILFAQASPLIHTGLYTLSVQGANGCWSAMDTLQITVHSKPQKPTASANNPICIGAPIKLSTPDSCGRVQWYGAGGSTNAIIDFGAVGYTNNSWWLVQCIDTTTGCFALSDTIRAKLIPSPSVEAIVVMKPICVGDSTILVAVDTSTIGQALGYQWYSDTTNSTLLGVKDTLILSSTLQDYSLHLVVTDTITGCTYMETVPITIAQNLSPLNITGASRYCEGDTLVLSASTQYSQYSWSGPNGWLSYSDTAQHLLERFDAGVYTLSVEDSLGCAVEDSIKIEVNPLPDSFFIDNGGQVCIGQNTLLQLFGENDSVVYTWHQLSNRSDDSIGTGRNIIIIPNEDTVHYYVVAELDGCVAQSDIITLSTRTPETLVAEADYITLFSRDTIIDVSSNDSLSEYWTISVQESINQGELINLDAGQFKVTLPNITEQAYFIYQICNTICINNCDTALVQLSIEPLTQCTIPNIFTPNNDGVNDFFEIPCLSEQHAAYLAVYNRWGDEVYKNDHYFNQWDGKYGGTTLPDGTYFYILQWADGKRLQGSVEIRR